MIQLNCILRGYGSTTHYRAKGDKAITNNTDFSVTQSKLGCFAGFYTETTKPTPINVVIQQL